MVGNKSEGLLQACISSKITTNFELFPTTGHSIFEFNFPSFAGYCPRANGAKRRSGRKPGARVTNSARLFTPGETKALAESKVHKISRAWVTNDGWSSH